jgi:2-C-methyl-D-erythritol 4-phosphate cytidylyltransferase/2-C-methyl-D-erythritol 2,4-cyclodiphosphate synthase
MKRVGAVVLAAGSGRRMGIGANKVYMRLGGETVLGHTLAAFAQVEEISQLVLVCKAGEEALALSEAQKTIRVPFVIVTGGTQRQYSVKNALAALGEELEYVLVHDAARCMVSPQLIRDCIQSAIAYGSGCAGAPVTDTVKRVEEGFITGTVERSSLAAVQTPQAFEKALLAAAHAQAEKDGFLGTDEAMLVERLGIKVRLVPSGRDNIKITTREDMGYAGYLKGVAQKARIGHGYDAHRLQAGRRLVLGGVEIPHGKGLLGHSDADVLTHAIMDALLGAAGLKDIGCCFPPSDERYKDAKSTLLLAEVGRMLREKSFTVGNIDATLVLQTPKIAPYIDAMRENIAKALETETGRVNIKATTTEGLGFAGREEGAAATAVCMIFA